MAKLRDGIDTRDNRLAPLVPALLPDFVRENHPKFITFLKKFYEFVEREGDNFDEGGPLWAARSLLDFQDLDLTEDRLLSQFHKEVAATIPQLLLTDKRTLYKNIVQFHRARGTEKSFQAFFRFVFNDEIDFYYPHTDIFRSSDGIWVVNKTIRVLTKTGDPFSFVDKRIFGTGSGTTAIVERVLRYQVGIFPVYELFLTPRTIDGGSFLADEVIHDESGDLEAKVYSCITGVTITNPGEDYEEGDEITVSGGDGVGLRVIVGSVGPNGEVKRVDIIDPGVNYHTVPGVTFATKSDTATGTAVKGALVTYPGFFLNENGFLSATKYLQDSYFYQQFSYVLKTNESINLYRDIVGRCIHPSGLILFGSVFADSLVDVSTVYEAPTTSENSYTKVGINWNLDDSLALESTKTAVVIHTPPTDEETPQFGPTYEWLDSLKFASLPHDPRCDIARTVPGVKLWVKSDTGIDRDEANRVRDWKNIALNAHASGGFKDPSSVVERPIITREDNKENLVKRSQLFSKGAWSNTGVSITDAYIDNADGVQNAARLLCTAGNTKHFISQDSSTCASELAESGQEYKLAIQVKRAGSRRYIWIGDTGDSSVHSAVFDLQTGALVNSENTDDEVIMDLGNGWYYIAIFFTRSTTGNFIYTVGINDTGFTSGTPETWNSAGTEEVYVYAAQIRNVLADDAYLPTFEGCEIRGYNGKALLRFDGFNDYLESYEALSDLVLEDEAIIYVAFFVRHMATDEATLTENEAVIQDLGQKLGLYLKSSGTLHFYHDDGSADSTDQPIEEGTFYVAVLRHVGGNISLKHNETLPEDSASSGDTDDLTEKLRIGWSTGTSTGGGGGGTGGGFFPEGYFGDGYFGDGFFPQEDTGGGGSGSPAFGKVSIGEIIIGQKDPTASMRRWIEDYLKYKWLGIPYRRETHWMSAPNETYWDQYANFQLQHRGDIILQDIIDKPWKRTTLTYEPYVIAREVISDIEEITFDLQPQYEVLRQIDVAGGNKVDWIKEQRRTVLRFEPPGGSGGRPVFTSSNSNFNGMPTLSFTKASSHQLQSKSVSSDVITTSVLMGKVVLRTSAISQAKGIIIGDSLSPVNWALSIDSGDFKFETRNGGTTTSVVVAGSSNATCIVHFKFTGGVMSIRLNGGAWVTQGSVSNISSLASNINIGGRGADYVTADIARILLFNTIPSAPDETLIDSILSQKYGTP